jgi:hypothetical protein
MLVSELIKSAPAIAEWGYWGVATLGLIVLVILYSGEDNKQRIVFGVFDLIIVLFFFFVIILTDKSTRAAEDISKNMEEKINNLVKQNSELRDQIGQKLLCSTPTALR